MSYKIKSKDMLFTFSDVGAELISAKTAEGKEYIWQGDEKYWNGHAPMLFPLCGRLKNSKYTYHDKEYDMRCHGFLSKSNLNLEHLSESKISFSLSDNEFTKSQYPFSFFASFTFEALDNTISTTAIIKNTDNDIIPFMFGVHPGFNLPLDDGLTTEDYYIDFGCESCYVNVLDDTKSFAKKIPNTYNFNNHLFKISEAELSRMGTAIFSGVSKEIKLFSPKGKHSIKINYSNEFNYFSVWKYPSADAKFICLEPWSGIPQDGIQSENFETRSSMIRLAPEELISFKFTITFY